MVVAADAKNAVDWKAFGFAADGQGLDSGRIEQICGHGVEEK
jgi:hypothetical protein